MTDQPQQPQGKQQIKIADNIPGAEYANAMQANHNKDEFQLMFLSIMGGSGKVTGKIMEETITIHQSTNRSYPIAAIGIGRFVTSHNLDLIIEMKYFNIFELGKSGLSLKIGAIF